MCERRRSSGCPHSLLRRSSADLPWRSGCRAQGTAREEEVDGEGQEGKVNEEGRDRVKGNAPWIWPWMTMNVLRTWAWGVRCHHQVWNSERYLQDQHHECAPRNRRSQRRHWCTCCALWAACCACRSTCCLWWCCNSSHICSHSFHRCLCFRRSHFSQNFAVLEVFVYTPVGDSELRWAVTEFWTVVLHQINSDNHTSNNWPNHRPSGFSDQSMLGPSSRWCSNEECHKIFASSTKMKKSFATFGNRLYLLGAWAVARLTMLAWSQLDALLASYRNQLCSNGATNCCGTH